MKTEIIAWIKDWFKNFSGNAKGIILGISGGKDSTICAKLCVEAVGRENVFGLLLPNGEQADLQDSIDVCNLLNIDYEIKNIDEVYAAFCNNDFSIETKINICPRIRMTYLYASAQEKNYRVCGTGNLSERTVGYFTKWGDGAYDFNPIGNLTKTEVVKLGDELGLPHMLVHKAPSDGISGKTDEDRLGVTYDLIDEYIKSNDKQNIKFKKVHLLASRNTHKCKPVPMFEFN